MPSSRCEMSAPPVSSGTTDHGASSPDARVVAPAAGRHQPSGALSADADGAADGDADEDGGTGRSSSAGAHADAAPSAMATARGDRDPRGRRPHDPAAAASITAISILRICSIACTARCDRSRVGIADELDQPIGDDLPRQSPAVLEPAARLLLAAVGGERRPVAVDLVLIGARHVQRDRLGEGELRPGIHRVVVATGEPEVRVHDLAAHAGHLIRIPPDRHQLGAGDEGGVEADRGLGRVVEPQERGHIGHRRLLGRSQVRLSAGSGQGVGENEGSAPERRGACFVGGPEGTRTPDPLHAMQVRYQLRHRPGIARLPARGNPTRLLHPGL